MTGRHRAPSALDRIRAWLARLTWRPRISLRDVEWQAES